MTDTNKISNRSGWTAIPNAIWADPTLTIEGKGMLGLLLSHADGWRFRRTDLMRKARCARVKFDRILAELKSAGYLSITRGRGENGRFDAWVWELHTIPTECPISPHSVHTTFGKPDTLSTSTSKNTKKVIKEEIEADASSSFSQDAEKHDSIETGFNTFWNEIWPAHSRKLQRLDCKEVYRQACTRKHAQVSPQALNRAAQAYIASVRDMKYLKTPLPWLRDGLWEPFLNRKIVDSNEFWTGRLLT